MRAAQVRDPQHRIIDCGLACLGLPFARWFAPELNPYARVRRAIPMRNQRKAGACALSTAHFQGLNPCNKLCTALLGRVYPA